MSSTTEPDSTDSNLESSKNNGKNVNSNEKSNDKDDVGLKEDTNIEDKNNDKNKGINEEETGFKSSDSVNKSETSTNLAKNNSSNDKSSEIKIVSGIDEGAEEANKSLADVSPAVAETSARPAKNKGKRKSKLNEDDNESGDFEGEGFEGFLDITNGDAANILKVVCDKEETEMIRMQLVIQNETSVLNSPPPKRRKEFEESDISSHCSSPALSVSSQLSVLSVSKRSRTGSPASRGSRKSNIDLSNPKFLVPFEHGWRREVVTRGITSREDGISKDVYYFHPTGKKLRSLREVSERLTPGLTIENFTFYKEPLGADPKYETIRNARSLGHSPSEASSSRATPVKAKVEATPPPPPALPPVLPLAPPPALLPALPPALPPVFPPGPSPNPVEPQKATSSATPSKSFAKMPKDLPLALPPPPPPKKEKCSLKFNKTPRIAFKKSSAAAAVAAAAAINGDQKSTNPAPPKLEGPKPHPNAPAGPRRKITPRKRPLKLQNDYSGGGNLASIETQTRIRATGLDMDIPSLWSPAGTSPKPSNDESLSWSHLDENSATEEGEQDYCTIRCTKAIGLIPTLQCSLCYCLYHPECCEAGKTIRTLRASLGYMCKKCQADTSDAEDGGLVKNITPEDPMTEQNPPIVSPTPLHPVANSPATPPTPVTTGTPQTVAQASTSKSAAESSTSWLPPSNSVFKVPSIPKPHHYRYHHHQHQKSEESNPPQSLVNVNRKRYIVVPKQNVLSNVAPNPSASPTKAEPTQNTTIITPTPTSTIIQGPPLKSNPFIQTTDFDPGLFLVPFVASKKSSAESSSPYSAKPVAGSSATQPSSQPDLPIGSDTPDHFAKKSTKRSTAEGVDQSMQKFMRNICIGYTALLNVFQYLKVQELLRAGRVCRLWRDIASHPSLWQTVRMKNSQVSDWKGFADSLSRHGTKHLDLRKMLTSLDESEEISMTFAKYIASVTTLERLEMCRCTVEVLEQIIESCPNLHVFNAQMISTRDQADFPKIDLEKLSKLKCIKELRLKSFYGLQLAGSLKSFKDMTEMLTTLSLTSMKNLGALDIDYIGQLENLEALELGECTDLPETFPHVVIARLVKLKRIRLEKGPVICSTNEMLYEMRKLTELVQLELINFDIKAGFDQALGCCTNIKRLLLIPTYVTQSATTNNIILSGAFKLWKSLTHFVWVVTMELLKVTELFVDQCEGQGPSRGSGGNCVPVLKPVPLPEVPTSREDPEMMQEESVEGPNNATPITVIPIDELFDMLTEALPNTRVKVLKIPFQNTWRQSLSEGSV